VLTTSRVARNSGGAARQENRPQSATAYSSVRYIQQKKVTSPGHFFLFLLLHLQLRAAFGANDNAADGQNAQGFYYDRIDKLVDALDKFTNKDLSVNYYSIEKAKTKVETSRSLGKKR
jgi:hypothetical protein